MVFKLKLRVHPVVIMNKKKKNVQHIILSNWFVKAFGQQYFELIQIRQNIYENDTFASVLKRR